MLEEDEGLPPLRWRLGPVEWVTFLIIVGLCVTQLFIPPVVGFADNGDYTRLMTPLGVDHVGTDYGVNYFGHLVREYRFVPRQAPQLISSQSLLAELARLINPLFSGGDHFDLRSMALVNLLFALGGLYLLLVAAMSLRAPARYVLGALLVFVLTDLAVIGYFNSFYSESGSLIWLLILTGSALCFLRGRGRATPTLLLYFLSAALFVAAKPQNTPLALPLALIPLTWLKQHWRPLRARILVSCSAALLIFTGLMLYSLPDELRVWNHWNAVFMGILVESPDPRADLGELGIDPALSVHAGEGAFLEGVPLEAGTADLSYAGIVAFYLKHPGRLLEICRRGASETCVWLSPDIGHYEASAGKPWGAKAGSLLRWHEWQDRLLPKSLLFLGTFFFLFLVGCVLAMEENGLGSQGGLCALLMVGFALMALLQFLTCLVSEGLYELVKHLFLFQVLFDACLAAAIVWLASQLRRPRPRILLY